VLGIIVAVIVVLAISRVWRRLLVAAPLVARAGEIPTHPSHGGDIASVSENFAPVGLCTELPKSIA
jgi:hypothetical protein